MGATPQRCATTARHVLWCPTWDGVVHPHRRATSEQAGGAAPCGSLHHLQLGCQDTPGHAACLAYPKTQGTPPTPAEHPPLGLLNRKGRLLQQRPDSATGGGPGAAHNGPESVGEAIGCPSPHSWSATRGGMSCWAARMRGGSARMRGGSARMRGGSEQVASSCPVHPRGNRLPTQPQAIHTRYLRQGQSRPPGAVSCNSGSPTRGSAQHHATPLYCRPGTASVALVGEERAHDLPHTIHGPMSCGRLAARITHTCADGAELS